MFLQGGHVAKELVEGNISVVLVWYTSFPRLLLLQV